MALSGRMQRTPSGKKMQIAKFVNDAHGKLKAKRR
jgi:hypothetical protein